MARHREPAGIPSPSARDRRFSDRDAGREALGVRPMEAGSGGRDAGPSPSGSSAALSDGCPTPTAAASAPVLPVRGSFDADHWSLCSPAVLLGDTGPSPDPCPALSASRRASFSPDDSGDLLIVRLPWSFVRRASSN